MPAKLKVPVGKRFGRLTVVGDAPTRGKRTHWRVICDCGTELEVACGNVSYGVATSCRCKRAEHLRRLNKTHGMSTTAEYKIWQGIKNRCTNKNYSLYKDYGGRGIQISEQWAASFTAFIDHVGPRPSKAHSIDRVDNSKGYEPGNVKWSTKVEQNNNTRRNIVVSVDGSERSLSDACRYLDRDYDTVYKRVRYGWSLHDAVMKPTPRGWRQQ